jgi:putative spermidine/putrescine transport system permease protein
MTVTAPPVTLEAPAAHPDSELKAGRGSKFFAWLIVFGGLLYFFTPLVATGERAFRAIGGVFSFEAFRRILTDPEFIRTFGASVINAVATIVVSLLVIVPTAYWVTLKVPRLRSVIEFITLLPFVIPAVVLVFGLIRMYSRPPLAILSSRESTRVVLICAYAALSFPYMYRSVDNGLRSINVRTLTEAAQSLGASWPTILWRVIFPNLRVALLSGALLTFAIVIGELTVALYLGQQTFGPYMANLVRNFVAEPAALTILSFGLTWGAMGIISYLTRRKPGRRKLRRRSVGAR